MKNFEIQVKRLQKFHSCSYCGEIGHTQFFCPKKPRAPLERKKPWNKTKPLGIKKLGKKERQWLAFRVRWKKNHPPNHEGYYICYICDKWILPEELTLDHIVSRSRAPQLVFDDRNIAPCCAECNNGKGSMSLEEYKEKRRNEN